MRRTAAWCASAIVAVALTGCAGTTSTPTAADPTATAPAGFDEMVEVAPGRELAVTCVGEGDPTVVFLHGMIQPTDEAFWAHSPELRTRLGDETRYCEYERANVGRSSAQEGPIPLTDTMSDLDAVLDAVGATEPVVLVGASYGGLIAYTFAGTHPDRVAGVVLLDSTLPDEPALDAYLPEDLRLGPESWNDSAEKIEVLGAYDIAKAALAGIPSIPGIIFVTEELWAPEGEHADAFRQAVRDQQAELMTHFEPGNVITVDAPHNMLSVIPDEIAAEVLAIVNGR